jgi:hypothetical protein
VVSPDGSRIAYFRPEPLEDLVVQDLVTGHRQQTRVTDFSDTKDWTLAEGSRPSWSPDSRRLLVPVALPSIDEHPWPAAIVLVGPIEIRVRKMPGSSVEPLGWVSDTELGWLDGNRLLVTGLRGGAPTRTIPLDDLPAGERVEASLAADGSGHLGLLTDATVWVYDRDGHVVSRRAAPAVLRSSSDCPMSWSGSTPWVTTNDERTDAVSDGGAGRVVQADPGLDVDCSVWADAALRGTPYRGVGARLFGTSSSSLSWHWREYGLGLLVLLVAAAGLVLRRRVRR